LNKESKIFRAIDLYVRLCEGKIINKSEESIRFGVDERTIQRDIDDIRAYLDEKSIVEGDGREIVYDRRKKGYVMVGDEPSMMTNSEILAVSKVLLESRAFTSREMKSILAKLVRGCVPFENMKLVSELLANESFHYVEPNHKEYIQDELWTIGSAIHNHKLVEIKYSKGAAPNETKKRVVEPSAIMFSEYYFYLIGYVVEQNNQGAYEHKYGFPAVFRLDRIKAYKTLNETFEVRHADRFEEGEFRKRIQFMYAGELQSIKLKFFGQNPEPVLDRLPTARLIEQSEEGIIIEAEVYGMGIIMWLLSQGNKIEVISPDNLRQEIKTEIAAMMKLYE